MAYDYELGYLEDLNIKELVGKTLLSAEKRADDELWFTTADGEQFKMYHSQDCCEHVYIDDIVGDLNDLVGSPITFAEESSSTDNPKRWGDEEWCADDSHTWTFYKLATVKGWVDIRWYGSSNGYYSESVDLVLIKGDGK